MALRADYVLRIQDEEADALTHSDFWHFRTEARIDALLEGLRFGVLDCPLESGETDFAEVEAAKLQKRKQRADEPKNSPLKT